MLVPTDEGVSDDSPTRFHVETYFNEQNKTQNHYFMINKFKFISTVLWLPYISGIKSGFSYVSLITDVIHDLNPILCRIVGHQKYCETIKK